LLGLFPVRLFPEKSQLFLQGVNLKKRAVGPPAMIDDPDSPLLSAVAGGRVQ